MTARHERNRDRLAGHRDVTGSLDAGSGGTRGATRPCPRYRRQIDVVHGRPTRSKGGGSANDRLSTSGTVKSSAKVTSPTTGECLNAVHTKREEHVSTRGSVVRDSGWVHFPRSLRGRELLRLRTCLP